jgi:hypothetical protein
MVANRDAARRPGTEPGLQAGSSLTSGGRPDEGGGQVGYGNVRFGRQALKMGGGLGSRRLSKMAQHADGKGELRVHGGARLDKLAEIMGQLFHGYRLRF